MSSGYELEYQSIREEVINLMNTKDMLEGTMYTLAITIIGLAVCLNTNHLVALMYIVLIPFQSFINTKSFFIARCGAYLKIYIEPKIANLHWEHVVHEADNRFNNIYRIRFGRLQLTRYLGKFGGGIFAVLALCVFIVNAVDLTNNTVPMSLGNFILFLIYIVLTIFIIYLNKKGSDFEKIYMRYCEIFSNLNAE